MLGWGSVFSRDLVNFDKYLSKYPKDRLFYEECDRIFTYQNHFNIVERDIIQIDRPQAMSKETNHYKNLEEVKKRLCQI